MSSLGPETASLQLLATSVVGRGRLLTSGADNHMMALTQATVEEPTKNPLGDKELQP